MTPKQHENWQRRQNSLCTKITLLSEWPTNTRRYSRTSPATNNQSCTDCQMRPITKREHLGASTILRPRITSRSHSRSGRQWVASMTAGCASTIASTDRCISRFPVPLFKTARQVQRHVFKANHQNRNVFDHAVHDHFPWSIGRGNRKDT